MNGINLRLKEIRKSRKMNMRKFSSFINIDNSQYSKIEHGKLMPTVAQFVEISSKFDVSLDWLIKGKGERIEGKDDGIKPYNEYPPSSNKGISDSDGEYITKDAYLEKQNEELEKQIESLKLMLKEKQSIINEKDAIIHEKNLIIETLKTDNKSR